MHSIIQCALCRTWSTASSPHILRNSWHFLAVICNVCVHIVSSRFNLLDLIRSCKDLLVFWTTYRNNHPSWRRNQTNDYTNQTNQMLTFQNYNLKVLSICLAKWSHTLYKPDDVNVSMPGYSTLALIHTLKKESPHLHGRS